MKGHNHLKKGDLVRVGACVGVVTDMETRIADGEISIWYGELTMSGSPRVRTVPLRSVDAIPDVNIYVSSQ